MSEAGCLSGHSRREGVNRRATSRTGIGMIVKQAVSMVNRNVTFAAISRVSTIPVNSAAIPTTAKLNGYTVIANVSVGLSVPINVVDSSNPSDWCQRLDDASADVATLRCVIEIDDQRFALGLMRQLANERGLDEEHLQRRKVVG